MHFRALRRDSNNFSFGMSLSLVAVQERRLRIESLYSRVRFTFNLPSVAGAHILQQPNKSKQFIPSGVRDGAILQISGLPESEVIAVARCIARHRSSRARPTKYINDVRAVLVDDHRGTLMIKIICTSANESIALLSEIGDHRRHIRMTRKPRLNSVFIGGHHIDQMVGHQGSHVSTYQVVQQWIGEWWCQDKECDTGGDRGTTNTTQSALPERLRSPARKPPRI